MANRKSKDLVGTVVNDWEILEELPNPALERDPNCSPQYKYGYRTFKCRCTRQGVEAILTMHKLKQGRTRPEEFGLDEKVGKSYGKWVIQEPVLTNGCLRGVKCLNTETGEVAVMRSSELNRCVKRYIPV